MGGLSSQGRLACVAALAVGYALLAHHTNTSQASILGPLLALGPLLLVAFATARGSSHPRLATGGLILGCMVLLLGWQEWAGHYSILYWMEHAGTELALCLLFARSLRAGQEPLCTGFARMVHGDLTPDVAHYTRALTRAWSLFFAGVAVSSTLLYLAAPLSWWSVFANFITAPLIGLMFLLEYAVRKRRLRDMHHAPLLEGVKAFLQSRR